jgi:argininosuccinate lyase
MGYNRDSREIKEWSALGFDKTFAGLQTLRVTISTLQVDHERMLQSVKDNYSSTTDLADMVARETGVGYRRIYSVVGRLVDKMIESNRPLYTLTAAEIVEGAKEAGLTIDISDEQVQAALDPAQAIAQRTHIGGPASGEMAKLIQARRDQLAGHLHWLEEALSTIEAARQETNAAVSALAEECAKLSEGTTEDYYKAQTWEANNA